MNRKIVCACSLIFLLIFPNSCQKKQVVQIPPPLTSTSPTPKETEEKSPGIVKKVDKSKEDLTKTYFDIRIENIDYENQKQLSIIRNSGIIDLTPDWRGLKIARATQEQIDFLKKEKMKVYGKYEWVIIDQKETDQFSNSFNIKFSNNPYQDLWGKIPFNLTRFYQDLNQDNVPEIFFPTSDGSGGQNYMVYQITKESYKFLGEISYMSKQLLNSKQNGFYDIVIFWSSGYEMGDLTFMQFDGKQYVNIKYMEVIPSEAIKDDIFKPEDWIEWEEHPEGDKLLWSPKDDDKYRKLISSDTFEVRIDLDYDNLDQEEATVKNSGIQLSIDWMDFKIGKATQEQFDALKKAGIAIYRRWEWSPTGGEEEESSSEKQKMLVVKDPYKDFWKLKENKNNYQWSLSRIYKDINQDGVPELFFPRYGGSGGTTYSLYQITKEGYLDLGSISYSICQTLPSKHNGFNDLKLYWHMSADDGYLTIEEFNGSSYEAVKEIHILSADLKNYNILKPDQGGTWEDHPKGDKLIWTPKDDEKYRRLIK